MEKFGNSYTSGPYIPACKYERRAAMGKRERWGNDRRKEADRIGALLAVFFVVAAGALVYLHQDAPRDGFLYKAENSKNG